MNLCEGTRPLTFECAIYVLNALPRPRLALLRIVTGCSKGRVVGNSRALLVGEGPVWMLLQQGCSCFVSCVALPPAKSQRSRVHRLVSAAAIARTQCRRKALHTTRGLGADFNASMRMQVCVEEEEEEEKQLVQLILLSQNTAQDALSVTTKLACGSLGVAEGDDWLNRGGLVAESVGSTGTKEERRGGGGRLRAKGHGGGGEGGGGQVPVLGGDGAGAAGGRAGE